ncbi:hypothetical protein [Larkinella sp. C7]|uniref:hypothetical protein n=1 Tax=Larkinella sp. C7 TaxID=2576607 RepID=UPI0011114ADF|nr:hypothetical protein [Larkinella sp. C7]
MKKILFAGLLSLATLMTTSAAIHLTDNTPAAIRDYVAKKMPGKKIKEAAEMLDATGKKTFEARVGGKDLIFDERGTLIK